MTSSPPPETLDPRARFERMRTVKPSDVDALGHVNNAVWVQFVVELATAHSDAVGMDWRTVRQLGGQWIVRRHEIDYHRSALPDQSILEQTWVESLRGARSVRCSRFSDADGAAFVTARTQWAFVRPDDFRPTRVPAELGAAFGFTIG